MQVLVQDGDEVILPAPYWVSFPEMARLAGATPVIVETALESNYKMTPEQLAAAIEGYADSRALAAAHGAAGHARASTITWSGVVERLIDAAGDRP